ncbi:helix-turn-helix domain-containing protein [Streptomyces zhihengii]
MLAATLDVLREQGYGGFTLEAVAARAGTTKPAIRRRWPVRQNLVIDALAAVLVAPRPRQRLHPLRPHRRRAPAHRGAGRAPAARCARPAARGLRA